MVINFNYYNKNLKRFARNLRKRSTLSEIILWNEVLKNRKLGYKFLRQRSMISYITDFFSPDLKLVIELDGLTHLEEEVIKKDCVKQHDLETLDYYVLRFKDEDVVGDFEYVKKIIIEWINNYEIRNPNVLSKKKRGTRRYK
jgi:very-short-patch-repair endonuclease